MIQIIHAGKISNHSAIQKGTVKLVKFGIQSLSVESEPQIIQKKQNNEPSNLCRSLLKSHRKVIIIDV